MEIIIPYSLTNKQVPNIHHDILMVGIMKGKIKFAFGYYYAHKEYAEEDKYLGWFGCWKVKKFNY